MRTYLTVIDDQPEARVALRFAARRAARTGGGLAILALVPPAEFVQWGAVQAAMEEEAGLRVEAMVAEAVGALAEEIGAVTPEIIVRQGEAAVVVRDLLAERPDIGALVLGAAAGGTPGPLVTQFGYTDAGQMPCPVMIIPGGLDDMTLDRLS